jgi:hypothetical protein
MGLEDDASPQGFGKENLLLFQKKLSGASSIHLSLVENSN